MPIPAARPVRVVATSADVPMLDSDGPRLLAALADAGATTDIGVWTDPHLDWPAFDLVLVRSTWEYHLRRDEFVSWARRCRATSNPTHVLDRNSDKRYLLELRDAGVPIVATVFAEPGQALAVPPHWTGDVVVKPAVSASAPARGGPGGDGTALPVGHRDRG
jgi:glutathione synthase/RimK-type ligase-like ATP-grasp enzyme